MTTESNQTIRKIYYDSKSELEIIKKYQSLIIYVYNLTTKYPINEGLNLVNDTKIVLHNGLEALIYAKSIYNKNEKLMYLIKVQVKLDIMIILVRLAFKNKFINKRNYTAWSYKITEINDMLLKWIRTCQKR